MNRYALAVLLALTLAACGSESPTNTPNTDAAPDLTADAADAPAMPVDVADAADAPTDPCGGLCGAGTTCQGGRCVAVDASADAPSDTGCPPNAERTPSGACLCVAGFTLCDGRCVDLSSDNANCNACRVTCAGSCVAGRCVIDAGADVTDAAACVSSTPGNCCGIACPTIVNAISTCVAGRCGVTCVALDGTQVTGDCDGNPANGCEIDLRSDRANCGACGAACAPQRQCVNRECVCPRGTGDCDGNPANGCETDTTINPSHCGRCGNRCFGTCRNGVCL